jgi:hypothetical protein
MLGCVIGDHTEPYPSPHTLVFKLGTASQSIAPLDHTAAIQCRLGCKKLQWLLSISTGNLR